MEKILLTLWNESTLTSRPYVNFHELPLQTLWHKVLTIRYQRYQQATTHNAQYTPYCLSKFHAHRIEARQHQVQTIALILHLNYLFPLVFLPQFYSVQT